MTISFARHRFPPAIIQRAVLLYVRFALSFRDVGDLLAERGPVVSYETVRRWSRSSGRCLLENLAVGAFGQPRAGDPMRWP